MVDYSRYTSIIVEKADKVITLTLNRPQALNAIDHTLHLELEDIFEDVAGDEEVNAVILTGSGRTFSAGGDIKGMVDRTTNGTPFITLAGARRLILNILKVEQPIIAALNGDAVGLAATVALFCDIILAAESARIGDPHVRVGLVAGDGGAIIWPLLAGLAKAKELLLTGDLITAGEAERLGVINRVLPEDQLMPQARALAQRLANGPTKAIRWTKQVIQKRLRDEVNLVLDASLGLEYGETFTSQDHQEAVRAFLEKREPRFQGR
ncbi:MAG: enoyl-CoA hydratase/isomerase family protein [Dehalococcoidia bacterium]